MTGSFEGCKVVVVGGSSGIGKGTAAGVVAGGGSAVIIGSVRAHQVIAATCRLVLHPPSPKSLLEEDEHPGRR